MLIQHVKTFDSGWYMHVSAQNIMPIYATHISCTRKGILDAAFVPFGSIERFYMCLAHLAPHTDTWASFLWFEKQGGPCKSVSIRQHIFCEDNPEFKGTFVPIHVAK